ncbi:hypothetical protein CASFOL_019205 [Castilleja foliolosa]|uniref:Nuclease associated modular domain-containing protein n=1 Tax=Castilleja foliolosa TaxID=1961234 RepID=A0ABD3D3Q2_9LAMI
MPGAYQLQFANPHLKHYLRCSPVHSVNKGILVTWIILKFECPYVITFSDDSPFQSGTAWFERKLSASRLPINPMFQTILPKFAYVIEQTSYFPSRVYLAKNICPCAGSFHFSSIEAQYDNIYTRQIIRSCKGLNSDIFEKPNSNDRLQVDICSQESVENEDDKEIQRRIKIGLANKGKVPWNKGCKHSEETRERIRSRTKEALKDPKVRKKMSEAPRALRRKLKYVHL